MKGIFFSLFRSGMCRSSASLTAQLVDFQHLHPGSTDAAISSGLLKEEESGRCEVPTTIAPMSYRVSEALKSLAQIWLPGSLVSLSLDNMADAEEAELASQAEFSSENSLNPNKYIISKYRFGNFLLQEFPHFVLRENVSFFQQKSSERVPA